MWPAGCCSEPQESTVWQTPAWRGCVDYKLSVRNLDPPEHAYHASVAMRKSEFELRRCSHGDTIATVRRLDSILRLCSRREQRSFGFTAASQREIGRPGALERTVGPRLQQQHALRRAVVGERKGKHSRAVGTDMGTDRRGAPVGNMEQCSDRDTAGSHQPRGSR
jgi:hypothetical protein